MHLIAQGYVKMHADLYQDMVWRLSSLCRWWWLDSLVDMIWCPHISCINNLAAGGQEIQHYPCDKHQLGLLFAGLAVF